MLGDDFLNKFMKMIACSLMVTTCLATTGFASEKTSKEDLDTPTKTNYYYKGKEISLQKAVKIAENYDVVFFDEYHDQSSIHQAESNFFKQMYRQNQDMILSLEMFERDVQDVMDGYLNGEISEEDFKAKSRPWPNYEEDYRPLIEFSKAHNIYVLAGNIPRRMAAQYAKKGDFSLITDIDRAYLPQKHLVEYGAYYNEFKSYMSTGDESQHMMMSPERIELFYKAQCLKDDTMAESINNYINAHKNIKVLHMQGAFHGNKHLGVVEKLHKLNPNLKILVITPVEAKNYESVKDNFGKNDMVLTFTRK